MSKLSWLHVCRHFVASHHGLGGTQPSCWPESRRRLGPFLDTTQMFTEMAEHGVVVVSSLDKYQRHRNLDLDLRSPRWSASINIASPCHPYCNTTWRIQMLHLYSALMFSLISSDSNSRGTDERSDLLHVSSQDADFVYCQEYDPNDPDPDLVERLLSAQWAELFTKASSCTCISTSSSTLANVLGNEVLKHLRTAFTGQIVVKHYFWTVLNVSWNSPFQTFLTSFHFWAPSHNFQHQTQNFLQTSCLR